MDSIGVHRGTEGLLQALHQSIHDGKGHPKNFPIKTPKEGLIVGSLQRCSQQIFPNGMVVSQEGKRGLWKKLPEMLSLTQLYLHSWREAKKATKNILKVIKIQVKIQW